MSVFVYLVLKSCGNWGVCHLRLQMHVELSWVCILHPVSFDESTDSALCPPTLKSNHLVRAVNTPVECYTVHTHRRHWKPWYWFHRRCTRCCWVDLGTAVKVYSQYPRHAYLTGCRDGIRFWFLYTAVRHATTEPLRPVRMLAMVNWRRPYSYRPV